VVYSHRILNHDGTGRHCRRYQCGRCPHSSTKGRPEPVSLVDDRFHRWSVV